MAELLLGTEEQRAGLIAICESAIVAESKWLNRDSHQAQCQVGECWALLRAGCDFHLHDGSDDPASTGDTIWLTTWAEGFAHHDYGGARDKETFYLPTRARLKRAADGDWY